MLKLGLLVNQKLFISTDVLKVVFSRGLVFDSHEVVSHSPRLLSIFTMCFMDRARYTASKNTWSAVQFGVLYYLPFYIGVSCFADSLIRRQLVITLDDIIFIALHIMTWHVSIKTPKQELFTAISTATPPQTQGEGGATEPGQQAEETE